MWHNSATATWRGSGICRLSRGALLVPRRFDRIFCFESKTSSFLRYVEKLEPPQQKNLLTNDTHLKVCSLFYSTNNKELCIPATN